MSTHMSTRVSIRVTAHMSTRTSIHMSMYMSLYMCRTAQAALMKVSGSGDRSISSSIRTTNTCHTQQFENYYHLSYRSAL